MKGTLLVSLLAGLAARAAAWDKAVFARYLVGNAPAPQFGYYDWKYDIQQANASGIDGFTLNIAAGVPQTARALELAFEAAKVFPTFKMYLNFDYISNGSWSSADVEELIVKWKNDTNYYYYNNLPLVGAFEGSEHARDWDAIKRNAPCFFIPNWSSLGPQAAHDAGPIDGLQSWNAWPVGATDMNTMIDQQYLQVLNDKVYMMSVSPWYFTDLPGYVKNWLWRGDRLWFDRWNQVLALKPGLVQLLTWNDYGESDYIGELPPVKEEELRYGMFTHGQAPYNYAKGMRHEGWRRFLPLLIQQYKADGQMPECDEIGLQVWYRKNPANNTHSCSKGNTTGNAPYQQTLDPAAVSQDKIFFTALLDGPAELNVTVGDQPVPAQWTDVPEGKSRGLYHGSAVYGNLTGAVMVYVNPARDGRPPMAVYGEHITVDCAQQNGLINWNAWVGAV